MSTRVQIIDPNKQHLEVLASTLLIYGNSVAVFDDGQKGYDAYFKYRPHLLICEPTLAGGDGIKGWELAFNLLRGDPKVRPYMVALSNRICCDVEGCKCPIPMRQRAIKALCEETGFDEFHIKPVDVFELLGWVVKAQDRALNTPA